MAFYMKSDVFASCLCRIVGRRDSFVVVLPSIAEVSSAQPEVAAFRTLKLTIHQYI